MRRRPFVVSVAALVAILAVWAWIGGRGVRGVREPSVASSWTGSLRPETMATRPDLLLVVYDARRRDDFSFGPFGNKRGDTPFLSAFKDDAVFLEDAVAPGCWTVPVHASMFSGLSVCDLAVDYYNPGFASFPSHFLSLAEILRLAGYHTVAYPDHPYFYNKNPLASLIRGFELFNVVNDFSRYGSYTNVGTPAGAVEHRHQLAGMEDLSRNELTDLILRFNRGEIRLDVGGEADWDPENRLYLAKLYPMFRQSSYFEKRYGEEFEEYVFTAGRRRRPYFLFLNLHMCTIAAPDRGLYSRWFLRTLMLNAQRRGVRLSVGPKDEDVRGCLERNYRRLGLRHEALPSPGLFMKQVFDNRFYDACFQAVWEYLEARGLTGKTVTVVTSDHGMSFGEKGAPLYVHGGARPHEYMLRVPLVLRFPAGSELSRLHGRYADRVSLTDLFETMLEVGIGRGVFQRNLPIRGRSLIHRLQRRDFDPVLLAESSLGPNPYALLPDVCGYSKAVYSGRLKLIFAPELRRTGGEGWPITVRLGDGWPLPGPRPPQKVLEQPLELLYDLSVDPHEEHNLAAGNPEMVERIRRLVSESWSCQGLPAKAETASWDREAVETLRSLGYIH